MPWRIPSVRAVGTAGFEMPITPTSSTYTKNVIGYPSPNSTPCPELSTSPTLSPRLRATTSHLMDCAKYQLQDGKAWPHELEAPRGATVGRAGPQLARRKGGKTEEAAQLLVIAEPV